MYAASKGLTVNVQEFYIVEFNAYRDSAVPVFRRYNQELGIYLPEIAVVWQAHEPCCVPCFEALKCSYTQSEELDMKRKRMQIV